MNSMYFILIGVIVLVVAIDLYLKKKNKKSESTDVEKFSDNVFAKEPKKFNPLLLIGGGLIVFTIAFFLTDKYVYDGRLSDNSDSISLIQNLTFDEVSINEILNKDSLWIHKTNLSQLNAIIFDSLGNLNGIVINGLQQGIWRYYHDNNKIKAELNFIDGRGINFGYTGIPFDGRDGIVKMWYENGNQKSVSLYINGIKDGPYNKYYENGTLHEEGNFKDDLLNGPHKTWYENGQLHMSVTYKLSDRSIYDGLGDKEWKKRAVYDGLGVSFHENGNKKFEGNYDQGSIVGAFSKWYINGNIQANGNFADSPHDNKYVYCTNCGSDGIREGIFKEYDQEGVIASASVYYYDWEIRYNNISEDHFYNQGKLSQITKYRDGIHYYDDNSIKSISWYKDGEVSQFQDYKNGMPYGNRKFY